MKLYINTFLAICLAAAGFATRVSAQAPATYTYLHRGDTALLLDVYRPANPRADSACVLAVFGGGFVNGSRDNELQTAIADELTQRGFTVVNIDYRLGLRDSVRVAQYHGIRGVQSLFQWCIGMAVEDCSAAIAYVVAHAHEWGIRPDRIVLTGSSAGAIAVLQTDYCRANALPEAAALPQGWKPAAVVPYSGAIMCGARRLHYATPPAPTLLLHGTKDKIVAYRRFPSLLSPALFGADKVAKEFRRHGYPHWIVRFEGIGHEVASFLPSSADLFTGFVDQVLHGRVTTLDATMSDTLLVPTEWTDMNIFDLYKQ